MRGLSDSFIEDLRGEGGLLHPILRRVHQDHTLMLSIRSGYINLYYRGGSILKLSELPDRSYKAEFDRHMDRYLAVHPKPEREFQQILARENNVSRLSNETAYFVTDIEFADSGYGLRFDLLALQRLAHDRKSTDRFRPVLMEMKYGDDALGGDAVPRQRDFP